MSRNYGAGSRDMRSAARLSLKKAALRRECAHSTAATHGHRFSVMSTALKELGIGRLEQVTREIIVRIGQGLADDVDNEDMSAAYAQNLISTVNTVMRRMTQGEWETVSPTKECFISKRTLVRKQPPTGMNLERFHSAIESAENNGWHRGAAIACLARDFGLRTKEGALLDARHAIQEAQKTGHISITVGTKGGRPRKVPITLDSQWKTLQKAMEIQGNHYSLIPKEMTWAQFRAGELRYTRELLQRYGITRLHELRAVYACLRYEALSGNPPPVLGGRAERELDNVVRLQIAEELGHGRAEITNSYVGGQRRGRSAGSQAIGV